MISNTVNERNPAQPATVIHNNLNNEGQHGTFNASLQRSAIDHRRTSASIQVIDAKSSQIIHAYAVSKAGNMNQIQSTAEACAKHLNAFIEKQEK